MYEWIFRHLPGPLWVRISLAVVLVGVALALMVLYLFPWMSQLTSFTDSTIGSPSSHDHY